MADLGRPARRGKRSRLSSLSAQPKELAIQRREVTPCLPGEHKHFHQFQPEPDCRVGSIAAASTPKRAVGRLATRALCTARSWAQGRQAVAGEAPASPGYRSRASPDRRSLDRKRLAVARWRGPTRPWQVPHRLRGHGHGQKSAEAFRATQVIAR